MRNHDTVRAEIARAAVRSFLRNGFEQTTVDDIAAAAGVSRRTYFRYFGSKDESLLSQMQEVGVFVAEHLARVPETVPPLVALREAFFQVESRWPSFASASARWQRCSERIHACTAPC